MAQTESSIKGLFPPVNGAAPSDMPSNINQPPTVSVENEEVISLASSRLSNKFNPSLSSYALRLYGAPSAGKQLLVARKSSQPRRVSVDSNRLAVQASNFGGSINSISKSVALEIPASNDNSRRVSFLSTDADDKSINSERKEPRHVSFPATAAAPSSNLRTGHYADVNLEELHVNIPIKPLASKQLTSESDCTTTTLEEIYFGAAAGNLGTKFGGAAQMQRIPEEKAQFDDLDDDLETVDGEDAIDGGTPKQGGRLMDESCYFDDRKRAIDFVLAYRPYRGKSKKSAMKEFLFFRKYRKRFEYRLHRAGLILEHENIEKSQDGKTCFVKIHAPWETLCRRAELIGMKVPIQEFDMKFEHSESIADKFCSKFLHRPSPFRISPELMVPEKEYFTARFDRQRLEMFLIGKNSQTFFTPTQRIRLVHHIIERIQVDLLEDQEKDPLAKFGLKQIGLYHLIKAGVYSDAYPMHDSDVEYNVGRNPFAESPSKEQPYRKWLYEYWSPIACWYKFQPLNQIRAYFGESTALYYAWIGFYTKMLIVASIVSIFCMIYGFGALRNNPEVEEICAEQRHLCRMCSGIYCPMPPLSTRCAAAKFSEVVDNYSTVFFAFFISIWAVCFVELWERKRNYLAAIWDTFDEENEDEIIDPRFLEQVKTRRFNPVTNEEEPYLSPKIRTRRRLASMCILGLCVLAILGLSAVILIYRFYSYSYFVRLDWKPGQANQTEDSASSYVREHAEVFCSVTAAVFNCFIISLVQFVCGKVCRKLTEFELPRTKREFDRSYTHKYMILQFVNYYSTIFYIAIFKGKFVGPPNAPLLEDRCPPTGCLIEVSIQLLILLVGKQIILNNTIEIGWPKLQNYFRSFRSKTKDTPSNKFMQWEKDFILEPSSELNEFSDFFEMIIQYGFITMFASSFPFASLFALLNNILEIRLDAKRLTVTQRRPVPVRTRDIHPWQDYLRAFTKIAVFSNAIAIAFTSGFVDTVIYKYRKNEEATFLNTTFSSFDTEDYPESMITLRYSYNMNLTTRFCLFRDYRRRAANGTYERTYIWWVALSARLAVVICFVYFVNVVQSLVAYFIPEVPHEVQIRHEDKIDEEKDVWDRNSYINEFCGNVYDKRYDHPAQEFEEVPDQRTFLQRFRNTKGLDAVKPSTGKRHHGRVSPFSATGNGRPNRSDMKRSASLQSDLSSSGQSGFRSTRSNGTTASAQARLRNKRRRKQPPLITLFKKMNLFC